MEWSASVNKKKSDLIHPYRHQKVLKKHISELQKVTNHLYNTNNELQTKVLKLENEVNLLQSAVRLKEDTAEYYDRINGNEIENFIRRQKVTEVKSGKKLEEKVSLIEQKQQDNVNAIFNLSRQLSNFDKLHMSMLELLENVESIDNKVDKNFPEFRKEISKLEVQMTESASKLALLKEDQTNTRVTMKAIGVTVSNLLDKTEVHEINIKEMRETMEGLKKSVSLQTSKLHDHILKVFFF